MRQVPLKRTPLLRASPTMEAGVVTPWGRQGFATLCDTAGATARLPLKVAGTYSHTCLSLFQSCSMLQQFSLPWAHLLSLARGLDQPRFCKRGTFDARCPSTRCEVNNIAELSDRTSVCPTRARLSVNHKLTRERRTKHRRLEFLYGTSRGHSRDRGSGHAYI